MGTIVIKNGFIKEFNDTLQITREQGFPEELILEKHLEKPFIAEDFIEKVFEFSDKKNERIFQEPPIRNFLVENRNGKWIYWGLIHIFDVVYDPDTKTSSGKFKIIYIYTPKEMKMAHGMIDRNPETDYFAQ